MAAKPSNSDSSSRHIPNKEVNSYNEIELDKKLLRVYTTEVRMCDERGTSTQHIGDDWMRKAIMKICGFEISERWLKDFRKRHNIIYYSGHASKGASTSSLPPKVALLQEKRIVRSNRREFRKVDERVKAIIVERQQKGERLTNPWIIETAVIIAMGNHPEMRISEITEFFGKNWLARFKRKYSVSLKPSTSDDVEREEPEVITIKDEIDEPDTSLSQQKPEQSKSLSPVITTTINATLLNNEFIRNYISFLNLGTGVRNSENTSTTVAE
ncbi:unnamed protein product [Caenorhabditis brenneri]